MTASLCKNCKIGPRNRPRGLCHDCYADKAIRSRFPTQRAHRPVSAAQMLLLAAASLGSTWTEWDLTAAAFRADPAAWCMLGYEVWPDHARVKSSLFGKAGLVGRGWVERVGKNTYQLTPLGAFKVGQHNAQLAEAS